MLSKTSQWHITMPVGGGIHAINKAIREVRPDNGHISKPSPIGMLRVLGSGTPTSNVIRLNSMERSNVPTDLISRNSINS